MRCHQMGSADKPTQRSGLGKQVSFPVWIRKRKYLYFGRLRLPVVAAFDAAMTIEEAYCQLVMSDSHPPSHRDDGRGSLRSYRSIPVVASQDLVYAR